MILLSIIFSAILFFFIGYKICYRRYKSKLQFFSKEKGGGRYGTIRVTGGYSSSKSGTIEFREIARSTSPGSNQYSGDKKWIKIEIIDVYPDNGSTESSVLSALNYQNWILDSNSSDTYYITWYDDSSQRVRDEKINQILK
jgi:hypothetical protein